MPYQKLITTLCCLVVVFCPGAASLRAEDSFTKWLEEFQAYDVLESELSQDAPSPETLLHRANLLLQSNNPEKALQILDQYGAFPVQSLEARCIWIKARALRTLNRPLEALLTYSLAAGLMTPEARQQAFESEAQLEFFWRTTLTKWLFKHCQNGKIPAHEGQKELLLKATLQARRIWSKDAFWTTVHSGLSGEYPSPVLPAHLEVLDVDGQSQLMVVKGLAGLAIGDIHLLETTLDKVSVAEVRQLWTTIHGEILGRELDPLRSEVLNIGERFPKYTAALEILIPSLKTLQGNAWQIAHPGLDSWDAYTTRLHNVPPAKALDIIQNELDSVLLSPRVKEVLHQLYFAYALITERSKLAKEIWSRLDKEAAPLSLKLCALVSGFTSLEDCLREQEHNTTEMLLLSSLLKITGFHPETGLQLPFWIRIENEKTLISMQQSFSLDLFLAYAVKDLKWRKDPSPSLAREAGLLFPRTSLGSQALLYLARQAYETGRTQLAWDYLQHMNPEILSIKGQLTYFQAKGGLLMDLNRLDESLETYRKLLRRFPQGLTPEKKLKIALLAQRRGDWKWAQKTLEELWAQHGEYESDLQAEIMFWLGEGAQKSGDELLALKYYLRLAWEFPGENIWAVTAMYRSALIYEKKGELATARDLFKKVLKQADRDSQKKAAQDRIEAIEDRLRLKKGQDRADTFLF